MIVGVLVELSNKNIDRIFDYHVPRKMQQDIRIGIRVQVPFGYQKLEGFILEVKEESNQENLKEIEKIIDQDIILNEELIALGKKMQQDTLSTLISCYQAMLPKALKAKKNTIINKKYDICYRLNSTDKIKLNSKQQQIIDCFEKRKLVEKKKLVEISPSSLKTLIQKKVLTEVKKEHYRLDYENSCDSVKNLTSDQNHVVESVNLNHDDVYLLYGVTGSGKTEVYIKLISKVIKNHQTAIVLVPEISLTPQMIKRFSEVFGNKIAAIHSALSEGEKYDEWRRINRGEATVVIGARSAIFAPLNDLGMIIIDEEHSDSYKQDSNPRYNAKDIAIIRGKYNHCPVLMGSATPSLESFARANKNVFKLLSMPKRVNGKKLPDIELIDMNEEVKKNNFHISLPLLNEIEYTLSENNQVILLLNRRGYSSFITCKNCGYTFKCPNCDITLTYHKTSSTLRCHYCGYGTKVHDQCPECRENSISNLGTGTEKIEEELKKLLPLAKVLRMDFDTTSRKGMHKKMIDAFKNHEYDILLGTQIVAKGLDFENVTLVGVINADTSLNIPDFRSSENTFSLLSQVSGRSGRAEKTGKVMIQTFNQDHYAIKYTKKHDYIGFYEHEMQIRKKLKYPPYYYLCYLRISSKDYDLVSKEVKKIKKSLERNLNNMMILGPSPSNIFRVNNVYRYGIILKYKKEDNLRKILQLLINHYKSNKKITLDIDFNPNHF